MQNIHGGQSRAEQGIEVPIGVDAPSTEQYDSDVQ